MRSRGCRLPSRGGIIYPHPFNRSEPPPEHCFPQSSLVSPTTRRERPEKVDQIPDTETPRPAMDNSPDFQQSVPATPSMGGPLSRSFPSSHSIASTVSPGISTPNSWSGNDWIRGTPDTSPPSSGVGSPELQAKRLSEDSSVSSVDESIDSRSRPAAKSVCFVGAGFVGMAKPSPSRCGV